MRLRIKDFSTKVGSGVTPRGGAEVYQSSGIPLYRSQNVTDDGFLLDDIAYISPEIDEEMSGSRIKPNDVLLNITGASIGRCYYIPSDFECGNVNQHVCIIRPNQKIVLSAYLHLLLISNKGKEYIKVSQTGSGREGLTAQEIKKFSFDIPSLETQHRIVSYLDAQTAKIDRAISLLEKKRDAYTWLKTAVINQAVTRGLNPNVRLKGSGVEWIGEIPEGWEVKRLRDISALNPSFVGSIIDDDVSFAPMESLRNDNIDLRTIPFAEGLGKYTYFKDGDLLIAKVTPCFENRNIAIAQHLLHGIGFGSTEIFVLRANKDISNRFLFYYIETTAFQGQACATMQGVGGLRRISPIFMKACEIALPPLSEQRVIASYLDTRCSKIDQATAIVEKQIDTYKRLKKSLINEVVTGQRKV